MIIEKINNLKEVLLNTEGVQRNEILQSLDEGLLQYTQNWYNKTSNVKTFLFNENPVRFEDVYVPLSLRYEKKEIVLPENVESLFKINNFISIVGHAGSGKTMLMKHSFLNVLQRSTYIPIIIELRRIDNTHMSLFEYISSSVFKINLIRNESMFNILLGNGHFIFFFDGYDEISIKNKEKRTEEIEEFTDRYNKNLYMLTSRPGAGAEVLSRFRTYHVCKMDEKQIRLFVEKQTRFIDEEGDQIAKKIISTVFGSKNSTIKEYLSNPLLLSMFILTFKYTPELPSKKSGFYFNVFDTLYCKHDTTSKSGGYLHERKCKMEKDQYLSILQTFSYISYISSKFEFDTSYINAEFEKLKKKMSVKFHNDDMIYDLSVSIGIWILDGLTYNFPHRSMQEYFAASLISKSEEDIRKMVYSRVLTQKYGYDGFNFWSLCEEVDEYCFLRYFVLDNLHNFKKELSKPLDGLSDNREIITTNYFNLIQVQIRLNNQNKISFIRHSSNLYTSILHYLHRDVNFPDAIIDWILGQEVSLMDMMRFVSSNDSPIIKFDFENEQMKDYLLKTHLPDVLLNQYEKLTELINSLELELRSKRQHEIDILNIS
jgi:energy-coupling factor transporter ATP-binding protein EcfA2